MNVEYNLLVYPPEIIYINSLFLLLICEFKHISYILSG